MKHLKVLSAGAVKRGVSQLAQAYARERGIDVEVEFATAPQLRKRMTAGEAVDVLVAPPALMEDLARAGTIVSESRSFIGRSRMGIVVHAQSDVHSVPDVEAFKRLLLAASTVVHNTASSGVYAAKLLEDLCPAPALGSRVVVVDTGSAVMEYVAAHPSSVGLAQISEIRVLIDKGCAVRMAAPLPDAVQNVTRYETAAVAGREALEAARGLASYMATPEAKKVFAATGID
ncbi:MAG TPA: substrate-binding domain-containing protein [Burkholderiales bacterium]|nr:substrate-binding domain-containing protein [Burkholderiales bacterium]